MDETLDETVRRLADESELLRVAASVRLDGGVAFALGSGPLRALFKPEIEVLESLGNSARDWSQVQVADGFNPRRIRDCEFHGRVILGRFNQYVSLAEGIDVVAGLSKSTLANCTIGHNALIRDVRLMANCVVGEEAVVVDCGQVTCRVSTTFGNGERLPLALEGGGREVEVFAEMDSDLAALAARPGSRRPELENYRAAVGEYRHRATSDRTIVGRGARIQSVQKIEDVFIGSGARIDGALQVVRSTLLSTPEEPASVESGSLVADSLLQWGVCVSGMAIVERSVLLEHSRVERQGKVQNSLVGANSAIAAGEVSSCLLGPFVSCPHQSLLISTYWPSGRGNIGYGANVGSNHTSRAPDQEFRAGEGLFVGLGVNVKFPCDFSRAPYTVIACGVDLPPQKVAFPFSLISPPREYSSEDQFPGVPPRLNQIRPAWMLYENIYALKRNEAKYRARNKATRTSFDLAVFRREIVEGMRTAARLLAAPPAAREFYTDRDIPGLGKNVLTEADRVRAVNAYRFYVRHQALLELRDRVGESLDRGEPYPAQLSSPLLPEEWLWCSNVLVHDFGIDDVDSALILLVDSTQEIAKSCERTRMKDDARGVRIIDDYADVHPPASRDRVVRTAFEDAERIREEIELIRGDVMRTQHVRYLSRQ